MTLEEKLAQLTSVWSAPRSAPTSRRSTRRPPRRRRRRRRAPRDRPLHAAAGHGAGRPGGGRAAARRAAARPGVADPAGHPGDRARGVPDRLHDLPRDGRSRPRSPGARRSTPELVERMTRTIGATCAPSASTRGSRPYSTSCATTAGAGSRRRSARTRTSSARSGPRTCAGSSRPGWSRRSSTSPATPPRRRPATTRRSRWGRATLRDVILIPFEMAIREGGARSVMNSYSEIDGAAGRRPTRGC